jgi:O-antigen ligase
MKKQPIQSATSLPPSPDEERRSRMIKYAVAMGIRGICVVLLFFVPGWWRLLPVIGAVILPYIAVVLANTASRTSTAPVIGTGALVPLPHSAVPHDFGADR